MSFATQKLRRSPQEGIQREERREPKTNSEEDFFTCYEQRAEQKEKKKSGRLGKPWGVW